MNLFEYRKLTADDGQDPSAFDGWMILDGPHAVRLVTDERLSRAEWEATIDINDREPIEWCYINGLPGYVCPDHEMHMQRDREHDAGRRGLVFVLGADLFVAAVKGET